MAKSTTNPEMILMNTALVEPGKAAQHGVPEKIDQRAVND
jgi:hypothetical protein